VVDERGIAASGTVTRLDLLTGRATHEIATGLHPNGLAWDEKQARLYVANNNSDSLTIIDTRTQKPLATIPLRPYGEQAFGVAPSALKLSPDGGRLYVACSGINAVAVIDTATRKALGYIPVAWYPNAVDISADGKMLAVASEFGFGYAPKVPEGVKPNFAFRGSVSVLPVPEPDQLAAYTAAVAENNRMPRPVPPPAAPAPAQPIPVPRFPGQPSPIEHVVYIIKENKTYDSYFGDLEEGNGDPGLLLYGEKIIPNHRRLARDFVLLDNVYSNGRHSDDGHQWLTQAIATGYVWWPGYGGRSSPFTGNDPIAFSSRGTLWDLATAAGRSVRVFGEYVPDRPLFDPQMRSRLLAEWAQGANFRNRMSIHARAPQLDRLVVRDYPVWDLRIPDVVRAAIFLDELKRWEAAGQMPHLSIVQLPGDHGKGADPGVSTMRAFVADNDLALGQIVEGLTRSRFWPRLAIFVIQDDAGNLPDHVDKARTAALLISPYARRRFTDSTFYSQVSVVKTIEMILGLPTLTLFDLIANDMRHSFQPEADLRPYRAVIPEQDLREVAPSATALSGPARQAALDTREMNFDAPDHTAIDIYARIEWHLARGWDTPFPPGREGPLRPAPAPDDK
jgi:YVTN family beta-propeller protein